MIIYKTTNKVNLMYYIGKDQKNNPNYLGSGIRLNRAIRKYGRENFVKEIIEECSDPDILAEREKYWIAYYNAVKDRNSYNVHEGGRGGNTGAYHKVGLSGPKNPMFGKRPSPERIEKQRIKFTKWLESEAGIANREASRSRWLTDKNPGKNKTPETIAKIKESLVGRAPSRFARYTITSPTGERLLFQTKGELAAWCSTSEFSLWTIERLLLHGKQPKSGTLVGWTASVEYYH